MKKIDRAAPMGVDGGQRTHGWSRSLRQVMVAVGIVGAVLGGSAARAQEVFSAPQVWFDVLFDEEGRVRELTPVDEAEQPAAFWDQMKARLQRAKIPPQKEGDQPATFRTGVRLTLNINKETSSVSIRGLELLPLVLKQYYASYPKDAAGNAGWNGEVKAICRVGVEGVCTEITVQAPAGMPESVRRFARVSMEGWRFKPQEKNGKPVEGEYVFGLRMNTRDDMPVDFRDPRKIN